MKTKVTVPGGSVYLKSGIPARTMATVRLQELPAPHWDAELTLTCLQGLVNRKQPRIYLVHDEVVDRAWLGWYRKQFDIKNKEVRTFEDLLKLYAGESKGYVAFHEEMIHTMNLDHTGCVDL